MAIVGLILAAVFGGLGGIFGKLALRYFSPFTIVFLRFFLALVFLYPILIIKEGIKLKRDEISSILLVSLLWAANVFGFIFGLQYTTAIMSQLMYLLVPLIVMALTKFFSKKQLLPMQIMGVVAGITGGVLLIGKSLTGSNLELAQTFGTLRGNAIILLAVFSWSVYLFVSKRVSIKHSPLSITTFSGTATLLIATPFFLKDLLSHGLPQSIGVDGIVGILGLAFINSVAMLFLYQWGTKNADAFSAASIGLLSPFSAAFVAIPLFGEKITSLLLISGSLILLGVYLSTIYPLRLTKRQSNN